MYYIAEALFVGIYSLVLYKGLELVTKIPFAAVLFLLGIVKHGLGYLLGIQRAYCKMYKRSHVAVPSSVELLLEGIVFVVLGLVFQRIVTNKYIAVFLTGFILHCVAEWIGVHTWFLTNRCHTLN